MTDAIPDLNYMTPLQCFPLYWFDKSDSLQEGITNSTLKKFRDHYRNMLLLQLQSDNQVISFTKSKHHKSEDKVIEKEDIFYYIYGLLHSEDYRERYKSNLDKSLPYIPLVPEFWQFSNVGRDLAELHLNYENQQSPEIVKILKQGKEVSISELTSDELKVKKMKIDKNDKTKIKFNDYITISNIPEKAWDYKINDYSAPKWIVERYQYKKDKKTDIINDPNTYSEDPAYILKLLLSVITVSLKTGELVQNLPSINFDELTANQQAKESELQEELREIEKIEEKEAHRRKKITPA